MLELEVVDLFVSYYLGTCLTLSYQVSGLLSVLGSVSYIRMRKAKPLTTDEQRSEILEGVFGGIATYEWKSLSWTMKTSALFEAMSKSTSMTHTEMMDFVNDCAMLSMLRHRSQEFVCTAAARIYPIRSDPSSDDEKRFLSMSSALFDFPIPDHCVLIDNEFYELMGKYLICTMMLTYDEYIRIIKQAGVDIKKEIDQNNVKRLYKLLTFSKEIYHILSCHSNERLPNWFVLFTEFKGRYPNQAKQILSTTEFRLLLTITMVKSGMRLPRDYAIATEFVSDYLWHCSNHAVIPNQEMIEE